YPISQKPRKTSYSAGVHPTAMISTVQKTGLPYNIVRFPNGPLNLLRSKIAETLLKPCSVL
ncbi:hypothetical protein OFN31_28640, partial [Escherichia coli]|nr:hypothetical protein [Escherichia coli]